MTHCRTSNIHVHVVLSEVASKLCMDDVLEFK